MFRRPTGHRSRGQSLVEFAFVLPVLLAFLGGTIQFGLIFWAQNTLTQIVRDTGRWAATQQLTCWPKNEAADARRAVLAQANDIAYNSSLLGYKKDMWTKYEDYDLAKSATDGIQVSYYEDSAGTTPGCPPKNNQSVYQVKIKISHVVPTFFPGFQYLPALGTCTPNAGCRILLSSTAQYRMEPKQ